MNAKNNTRPGEIPPGIHATEELAFPMLAKLIRANEAARAKRLRTCRVVYHRHGAIEAGEYKRGGAP